MHKETAGPSYSSTRISAEGCFVSGLDFSRAAKELEEMGFSPCYGAHPAANAPDDNFRRG
jgi:hypothetical protein